MGVKVETLYAYVSRGVLESYPGDGRARLVDARAVDALARRGRPRQSSRDTSLNLLIETSITSISTDGVRYRGHLSSDLARTCSFEQVAELLWTGSLPHSSPPWNGSVMATGLGHDLPTAIRLIAAHVAAAAPSAGFDIAAAGRAMIASMTDSLALVGSAKVVRLPLVDQPPISRSIAARLWGKLSVRPPTQKLVSTLNTSLVLLADHDLATSTLGVRVAASTRANPYAAVTAGLSILSGSLHGGASRPARALIDDALTSGASRAVSTLVKRGERMPGFGHTIYPALDPRAAVLLERVAELPGSGRAVAAADSIRADVLRRFDRHANVDFAMALFTHVAGMSADAAEAMMAVARTAGWLAHALEEYQQPPLRFRPRSLYTGTKSAASAHRSN